MSSSGLIYCLRLESLMKIQALIENKEHESPLTFQTVTWRPYFKNVGMLRVIAFPQLAQFYDNIIV